MYLPDKQAIFMTKYTNGWQSIADEEGVEIENYEDLILFRSPKEESTYPDSDKGDLVGVALHESYRELKRMGMDSPFLPRNYEGIQDYLPSREEDWFSYLRNPATNDILGRAEREFSNMFLDGGDLDVFEEEGKGSNSVVFRFESKGETAAVETPASNPPYAVKEFLSLYASKKVLEEVQEDLELPIRSIEPHFANPFFFVQEHIHAPFGLSLSSFREVEPELKRVNYEERYGEKAEKIIEDLQVPARYRHVDRDQGSMAQKGEDYCIFDGGSWETKRWE